VAVGFPAIPRLPVTITTMSISFLIWPQVGGSLSHVCLTSSHFLSHPLFGGGVSLSGSLSWGESSSLSLLMFGTRGSMRLDKPWWYPHWVLCTFRKNRSMPSTPHQDRTRTVPFASQHIFQRTRGLTVGSWGCQCLSASVKLCSGQLKKLSVYNAIGYLGEVLISLF
jgi:hypothetical protein